MDPYNPFGYTLPPTMPVYLTHSIPPPAPYAFDLHSHAPPHSHPHPHAHPRQPLAPLPSNLPLMSLPPSFTPHSNPLKRTASTPLPSDSASASGAPLKRASSTKPRAGSAKPSLTAANNKHLEPLLPSYTANVAGPASDENTPFQCPRCDKVYKGKHARSIWRRHMQDKHGVALKDQPRRTRWDNGKSGNLSARAPLLWQGCWGRRGGMALRGGQCFRIPDLRSRGEWRGRSGRVFVGAGRAE